MTAPSDRDALLRDLLPLLSARGVAGRWAHVSAPGSALELECERLAQDEDFMREVAAFLSANPTVQLSVETLLAHMAMAASCGGRTRPRSCASSRAAAGISEGGFRHSS
jgi:hypothetical protein